MSKIMTGLTAMTGGHMVAYAALGAVIVFTAGHFNGVRTEKNAEASRQLEEKAALDEQSVGVQIDTSKIAKELSDKIAVRADVQSSTNVQEIERLARKEGELLGKAAGYQKGYEDALKIPNTCINDPAFLPDSMRVDAESRYRAIFGSPDTPR